MTQRVHIVRTKNQFAANRRFLKGIMALCDYFLKPYKLERELQLHQEKILTSQQKREIAETEKAIKGNRMVLLEMEIEKKNYELIELRRKLGLNDDGSENKIAPHTV